MNVAEQTRGRGWQLPPEATIEDQLRIASFNWKVQRAKVRFHAERDGSDTKEWPEHCVLFRSDTKMPLAIVPKKFKVLQPANIFTAFRTHGTLCLADALHGGTAMWAMTDPFCDAYVPLMITGHKLLRARIDRPIDVQWIAQANNCIYALDSFEGNFGDFAISARRLAKHDLDEQCIEALTRLLLTPAGVTAMAQLSPEQRAELQGRQRESRNYKSIIELWKQQQSLSAWAWVHAVAHHIDWQAPARSDDERIESAWFGRGLALKTRAISLALAEINAHER